MNTLRSLRSRDGYSFFGQLQTAGIALLALLSLMAFPLGAQDKKESSGKNQSGAGLMISAEATAKEVGLPIYPHSRPHKDEGEKSSAVQMGLWGSTFGFKLVVLKMESNDAPEKVAAFYQKALARYGTVLNCTNSSSLAEDKGKNKSAKGLDCEDDKPESGGQLFKAGTKERQHIVGVQPNGPGSIFQLVFAEARGEEKPL
jgi:hypothetical protein